MQEGGLPRVDAARVSTPLLERGRLESAYIREGERPRAATPVDRVEVLGRLDLGLAAGEENDAGHRLGHPLEEATDRLLGDLGGRRLRRALLPGDDHVRL